MLGIVFAFYCIGSLLIRCTARVEWVSLAHSEWQTLRRSEASVADSLPRIKLQRSPKPRRTVLHRGAVPSLPPGPKWSPASASLSLSPLFPCLSSLRLSSSRGSFASRLLLTLCRSHQRALQLPGNWAWRRPGESSTAHLLTPAKHQIELYKVDEKFQEQNDCGDAPPWLHSIRLNRNGTDERSALASFNFVGRPNSLLNDAADCWLSRETIRRHDLVVHCTEFTGLDSTWNGTKIDF